MITAVGITVGGLASYLIPGAGWVIGGALTSAGVSGIIAAAKDPDISWADFGTEVGIGAAVGAVTGGTIKGLSLVKAL